MNKTAAIIIPVYNEAAVVVDVVRRVRQRYRYVVCVDDGSTDNSRELLHGSGAYVIEHPMNMGQGSALQTGIEFARLLPVKYFVTFDADGQHVVDDIERLLRTMRRQRVDVVFGSRFLDVKPTHMTHIKKCVLKCAVVFSSLTSGLRLTDTHNGARVFNRNLADDMQITMSDMAHASEILDIVRRGGYSYTEAPVQISYTDYSRRKGQSGFNAINIAFDMLLRKVSK